MPQRWKTANEEIGRQDTERAKGTARAGGLAEDTEANSLRRRRGKPEGWAEKLFNVFFFCFFFLKQETLRKWK